MGPGTVVGIVFIILKLVDVITWPWIWVLAPFWLPLLLFFGLVSVVMLVTAPGRIIEARRQKRIRRALGERER